MRAWTAVFPGLALACASRPQRWTPPPKGPQLPPSAAAAVTRELPGCPPELIYADQFQDLIQASGCDRLVYLLRNGAGEWARASDEFPLPKADDLHTAEGRLQGARLRAPVLLTGKDPFITLEQAKTLRSWSPKAVVTCLLGTDGLLHACFVRAEEPVVEKAVRLTLPAFKYQPATADGAPVPATFQVTITVPVPRPNCAALADPLREKRCAHDLDSPQGPAAADPEIWGLPLGI